MRLLAISYFDPASVVLSHRNLMRAAGHDMRLAVVRAYTEKQREADYVCEQLVFEQTQLSPLTHTRRAYWEKLTPNLEELREFAAQADVIQFHPGIGHGDGDWASQDRPAIPISTEFKDVVDALGLDSQILTDGRPKVAFFHGSRSTWATITEYGPVLHWAKIAASTIDYAQELDAAYLPPLVDVGSLRAPLRGDDDPLLIAHTPTDRVACSTEEFLKAAQGLGIPVRLGEGLKHADVLRLKAECNVGFDHLRGAFSTNTLENAALGLAPLFALKRQYMDRLLIEGVTPIMGSEIVDTATLRAMIHRLNADVNLTRAYQKYALDWWILYFSAEPITKRLVKFYEGL